MLARGLEVKARCPWEKKKLEEVISVACLEQENFREVAGAVVPYQSVGWKLELEREAGDKEEVMF